MITIKDIRHCEMSVKKKFLDDCLAELRDRVTPEEKLKSQKFSTGFGPDKTDFKRVMATINSTEADVSYWIKSGRIFRYSNQLEHVFLRYEYILNQEGF